MICTRLPPSSRVTERYISPKDGPHLRASSLFTATPRPSEMRSWVVLAAVSIFLVYENDQTTAFSLHIAGTLGRRSRVAALNSRFGRLSPCMRTGGHNVEEVHSLDRRRLLQSLLGVEVVVAAGLSQQTEVLAAEEDVVLVVGATSTMGQDACKDLLAMGYNVRGLTRRADDVKQAVVGTELDRVEWVGGNLNELGDLAPAMKGVTKVIFCPLLATRAGLDPTYAASTMLEDIQMSRRIYFEAVSELLRLGKQGALSRFVLVSSAGVASSAPLAESAETPKWRRLRVEPSLLNEDVVRWKLKGEHALKTSNIPYTLIRAYAPPPRPWNDPDAADFNVAIFSGDRGGVAGTITRSDLGHVAAAALVNPRAENATFQAINVRKTLPPESVAAVRRLDPRFPDWRGGLSALPTDPAP